MSIWLIKFNGAQWRWEVGFYDARGTWEMFDVYRDKETAVNMCHYLNGGK